MKLLLMLLASLSLLLASPQAQKDFKSTNGRSQPSKGSELPMSMSSIQIPHHFTQREMDQVAARLRAFSFELQLFSVTQQSMSEDQKQQNYQYAIWPIMQCLVANP